METVHKQADSFLWCLHQGQAGVFPQNQDKNLSPTYSNWLWCYRKSHPFTTDAPLQELTYSCYPSKPFSWRSPPFVSAQEAPVRLSAFYGFKIW